LPEKLGRLEALKALIVVAAFLAPIAVAAGVSEEPVLESSRTLAVALGAAWVASALVGYGFYGGKRCIGAATLLTVAALVALVVYARPWVGEEVEENVMFWYAASFSYENSEDNLPIENVMISFPHPNVENEPVLITGFSWLLFGPSPENRDVKILQIQDGRVIQLVGDRTATLFIQSGRENTSYGPRISLSMDRLYPREVIWIQAYALTSPEKSKDITVCENKENQKVYARYQYRPPDKITKISFWVRLSKKMNDNYEKMEEFGHIIENAQPLEWSVWDRLYPIN